MCIKQDSKETSGDPMIIMIVKKWFKKGLRALLKMLKLETLQMPDWVNTVIRESVLTVITVSLSVATMRVLGA